jgi:hypothetical protein
MLANGQSSLPSIWRRNTRLDFFESGELAKDFLDIKTRKAVLDKFSMLEIRLRRLFKGMDSIEMGVGRPSNPRCLNLYAKHRNKKDGASPGHCKKPI